MKFKKFFSFLSFFIIALTVQKVSFGMVALDGDEKVCRAISIRGGFHSKNGFRIKCYNDGCFDVFSDQDLNKCNDQPMYIDKQRDFVRIGATRENKLIFVEYTTRSFQFFDINTGVPINSKLVRIDEDITYWNICNFDGNLYVGYGDTDGDGDRKFSLVDARVKSVPLKVSCYFSSYIDTMGHDTEFVREIDPRFLFVRYEDGSEAFFNVTKGEMVEVEYCVLLEGKNLLVLNQGEWRLFRKNAYDQCIKPVQIIDGRFFLDILPLYDLRVNIYDITSGEKLNRREIVSKVKPEDIFEVKPEQILIVKFVNPYVVLVNYDPYQKRNSRIYFFNIETGYAENIEFYGRDIFNIEICNERYFFIRYNNYSLDLFEAGKNGLFKRFSLARKRVVEPEQEVMETDIGLADRSMFYRRYSNDSINFFDFFSQQKLGLHEVDPKQESRLKMVSGGQTASGKDILKMVSQKIVFCNVRGRLKKNLRIPKSFI